MSTIDIMTGATVLLLLSCSQPRAGSYRRQQREPTPLSSVAPSPVPGTVSSGELAPDKGELPPGPVLTPEERERLLQGTMRKVPDNSQSEGDHLFPSAR